MDLLVIGVAFAWFLHNATLPDAYNGRLCCDSVNYRDIANSFHSVTDVLTHYAYRTLGYPLFLRAHAELLRFLHLETIIDWISFSLVTAFILHIASSYFLYMSIRAAGWPVPRLGLYLLLLHPGLTAYAAVPITDSLSTSLVMILLACLLRLRWAWSLRNAGLALAAGSTLAWLVLSRPPHYVPALLLLVALLLTGLWKSVSIRSFLPLLLPLCTITAFALLTAPRHIACTRRSNTLCFMSPADRDFTLRVALLYARIGPRTYGVLYVDPQGKVRHRQYTVPDHLTQERFGCLLSDEPTLQGLLHCYRNNLAVLPLYWGKKLVGLFDNLHLNAYAAVETTPLERGWNRIFSVLGFVGFLFLWILAAIAIVMRHFRLAFALPLLYIATYTITSLVPHTEARFGFPLVPLSLFALAYGLGRLRTAKSWMQWIGIGTLSLAALLFLWQVHAWDTNDALLNGTGPAHQALR